ncbi:DNA-binding protein [Prunus dulcis]|uniref:DNA-binding protein n=1 Tax=Prunus dulcis TaxID=3755 RepID=A0A4Y1RHE9_PRUDU|nr:DNA-binding protein [Prunus dulcis]
MIGRDTQMATPKEHVEDIRKKKFSIGAEAINPLTEDLHQAVKNLSAELYAKDIHFLMELIQNAEDNEYAEVVDPSLEFLITSRDITGTGAPATLLNPFAVLDGPPKKATGSVAILGRKLYGSASALPTTTLILPLKPDKVQAVQQQLSSIHPEVLLFLSKIKRLSVREDNEDPSLSTVSAIEIVSETDFVTRKNIDAQSYTLHLSAEESGKVFENECGYYMWKQKFPVKQECRVERRMEVDEWVITLAFPIGERLRRGMNTSSGIYAFLPTEMESIKAKIVEESIVPSEPHKEQKFFYKPREVGRLMPAFWNILRKAEDQGVEYDHILSFLGVEPVDNEWYAKCIQGTSNLVTGVSDVVYLELLLFIADNWEAIWSCSRKETLVKWLSEQVKVCSVSLYEYAVDLFDKSLNERKLVIAIAHFLYQSLCKSYISDREVDKLCRIMPLVDKYGSIIKDRAGVIVPANGSKWAGLTDSNLWRKEGYVELREDYLDSGRFAGNITPQKKLLEFLKVHAGALDVPYISAPSDGISALSAQLTKQNTFLLLDWIHQLMYQGVRIPQKFLTCIKDGGWLKVTLNGSSGVRPPSQSFLLKSSWGNILQDGSVFVDIPLIDQSYYGERINSYKDELKKIGVRFEYAEACEYMGKHLMSLASSSTLTRDNVLSVLRFIKFLRDKYLSPDDFICSIKEGQWLKTSLGFRSPVGSVLSDKEWEIASKVSDIPFIDKAFYGGEICKFKNELELLGVVVSISKSYQLIIDNLKSPSRLTSLPAEAVLLMLQCMQLSSSSEKLVRALKGTKCLKTTVGYKSPNECLLPQVFSGLPLIDHNFYGKGIYSYRNELKKTGAVVDFDEAAKVFARYFRQYASSASITKENVEAFLSCYRKLEGTPFKFPADLKSCICKEKWLRTRLGGYRSPRECILFCSDWESISPICLLPFIDDSDTCYGKNIHEYKQELKSLGVVVEFKDGVKFVPSCLYLPQNPSSISRENALALLDCIHILLEEKDYSFPDVFKKKVSQAWLKAHDGYEPPSKCLLFDSEFGKYLKQTDGPFIDEEFYGSKITTYRKELSEIGVIVEVDKGCPLLASQLALHDELSTFVRVYSYLSEFKWEPDSKADKRIWFPKGNQNGEWVNPEECVIYDKDELFGLQLTVLEKYFEHNLLVFFSRAYGVKSCPSIEDYCRLWKHWNSKTEKTLAEALVKVPINSGSAGILLCNKQDVFIADDLQLQYLFEQSSHQVFVWYPQPSLASLPRTKLLEIYREIGVRTISESVQKEELFLANDVELQLIPTEKLIGKALLRLILGFLACAPIKMEAEKRQKAVQGLANVAVVETSEPNTVSYDLPLSSGKILNVRGSRKVRWDREDSKIFTEKMDRSGGYKSIIEFATYFSEAISEFVLWEIPDHIHALSELIKLAFVLDLDEEAVTFLMKSKNLQIFAEDEEFLNSAYRSE